jgi:hypothetical protein
VCWRPAPTSRCCGPRSPPCCPAQEAGGVGLRDAGPVPARVPWRAGSSRSSSGKGCGLPRCGTRCPTVILSEAGGPAVRLPWPTLDAAVLHHRGAGGVRAASRAGWSGLCRGRLWSGFSGKAEGRADVIVWDGGNNDWSFFVRRSIELVLGRSASGRRASRVSRARSICMRADVVVLTKLDTATPDPGGRGPPLHRNE